MRRAFVLGAGLGTRLRPLTDQLPKPLIPVHHRPLISYAFAHLRGVGAREFVVNTHHLPAAYDAAFPDGTWNGCPLTFRHEPVLLETGGGLANVADLFAGDESFLVYNGDILTDLPLAPLLEAHEASGNLVTLALRSGGGLRNVAFDEASGLVTDLRNALGSNSDRLFLFSGVYAVSPAFFRYLEPGRIESVVGAWLRAIRAGERVGGVVIDDGVWLDLGNRESYLAAHALGRRTVFPLHEPLTAEEAAPAHPGAVVSPEARVDEGSSIGPGAVVEAGATLENTVVWPGGVVKAGGRLKGCVVRSGSVAEGVLENADV